MFLLGNKLQHIAGFFDGLSGGGNSGCGGCTVNQVVGHLIVGQAMSLLLTLVAVDATLIVDHMDEDQAVDLAVVLKQ